jgi:hypothetical protein
MEKGGPPQSIRCPISIIVKSPTTQPHFHANQNSHAFQITFILTDFRVPFCWHGDDKQENCENKLLIDYVCCFFHS